MKERKHTAISSSLDNNFKKKNELRIESEKLTNYPSEQQIRRRRRRSFPCHRPPGHQKAIF